MNTRALRLVALLVAVACKSATPTPAAGAEDIAPAPWPTPTIAGPMRLVSMTHEAEPNLTRGEARLAVTLTQDGERVADGVWVVVLPAAVPGARPIVTGALGEALAVAPGDYDVRVASSRGAARQEAIVRGVRTASGERTTLGLALDVASASLVLGTGANPAEVDLVVRDPSGGRLVVRAPADRPVVLPPGDYLVDVVARDSDRSPLTSKAVRLAAGETSRVDVFASATGRLIVTVDGINGTGALTDGVTIRAKGPAGEVVVRTGEEVELAPGEYTVAASVAASPIAVGSASRAVKVGPGGTARITITVPIAVGWVRAVGEGHGDEACTTSVRAKSGVARAPLGAWIAVPAGEVDVSVRCGPGRAPRRFPGLVVEAGERQEHRVRW